VAGDRQYHRFVMGSADFRPYGLDLRVPRKKETPYDELCGKWECREGLALTSGNS